ncbi:MAG TPA: type II toxin-antitoxin system VapB family antitoxin [Longimicrobiales bacterium]|nr:type II toxin-antitoxin system VapB family antitoxin [Longimicrobiales bacterium]
MPLNIKNPEVERLVSEVAELTGESKTEAVRRAMDDRLRRLRLRIDERARTDRLERFLKREVWSRIPDGARAPSKAEREEILGYGDAGV